MPKLELRHGEKFGQLTVLQDMNTSRSGGRIWLFKCNCGTEQEIPAYRVVGGKQTCCTHCSHNDGQVEEISRLGHTAGRKSSPEYSSWQAMKTRCLNEKAANYHLYGGRGIEICSRWQHSFKNFLGDMGKRPDGTSLDRIDPNGNYEPGNCRWVDAREQRKNVRSRYRVKISFAGLDLTIPQWSERLGVSEKTIRNRRSKRQPVEKVLREALC